MTPGKILIIDDDARNTFALGAVLKARGYACVTAGSAQQGIAFLNDDSAGIEIVLLDMMMPGMDGYEAIPIIKSGHPGIPLIAVTAQAMTGDRDKCLQAGADDYLSKPVDVDKLQTVLRKHLQ